MACSFLGLVVICASFGFDQPGSSGSTEEWEQNLIKRGRFTNESFSTFPSYYEEEADAMSARNNIYNFKASVIGFSIWIVSLFCSVINFLCMVFDRNIWRWPSRAILHMLGIRKGSASKRMPRKPRTENE